MDVVGSKVEQKLLLSHIDMKASYYKLKSSYYHGLSELLSFWDIALFHPVRLQTVSEQREKASSNCGAPLGVRNLGIWF